MNNKVLDSKSEVHRWNEDYERVRDTQARNYDKKSLLLCINQEEEVDGYMISATKFKLKLYLFGILLKRWVLFKSLCLRFKDN